MIHSKPGKKGWNWNLHSGNAWQGTYFGSILAAKVT